jgi:hypothetical protein
MASLTSSEGGLDQLHQDTVDALYSLVTNFTALSDENKELFVESLTELTAAAVSSIGEQLAPAARTARKQLVYFLTELVKANEQLERDESADPAAATDKPAARGGAKGKGKPRAGGKRGGKGADDDEGAGSGGFAWAAWRHSCLKVMPRPMHASFTPPLLTLFLVAARS